MKAQTETFCSFESEHIDWLNGLQKTIDKLFINESNEVSILDIACGDGSSIEYLKKTGFKNIIGIDINGSKIEVAKQKNPDMQIYLNDIHRLVFLFDKKFDIIFSSHTLEHSLYPLYVLKEFQMMMTKESRLFLIVPYPIELSEGNPAAEKLCLNIKDDSKSYLELLQDIGFKIVKSEIANIREPEIITIAKLKP